MPLLVTDISFRRAPPHLAATGLVGFVTLAIDETVVLRDVALRRTRAGHYGLSFACGRRGRCRCAGRTRVAAERTRVPALARAAVPTAARTRARATRWRVRSRPSATSRSSGK
jgi:hypothetical protein